MGSALLTLALLESQLGGGPLGAATDSDLQVVRNKCVFTTHTPVPAGHDRFSTEQAYRILGGERTARLQKFGAFHEGLLNMTMLALRFSRYANGVALQHGKVSREMRKVRSLRWSMAKSLPIFCMKSSSGVSKRCIGSTTEARRRFVISETPSSDMV